MAGGNVAMVVQHMQGLGQQLNVRTMVTGVPAGTYSLQCGTVAALLHAAAAVSAGAAEEFRHTGLSYDAGGLGGMERLVWSQSGTGNIGREGILKSYLPVGVTPRLPIDRFVWRESFGGAATEASFTLGRDQVAFPDYLVVRVTERLISKALNALGITSRRPNDRLFQGGLLVSGLCVPNDAKIADLFELTLDGEPLGLSPSVMWPRIDALMALRDDTARAHVLSVSVRDSTSGMRREAAQLVLPHPSAPQLALRVHFTAMAQSLQDGLPLLTGLRDLFEAERPKVEEMAVAPVALPSPRRLTIHTPVLISESNEQWRDQLAAQFRARGFTDLRFATEVKEVAAAVAADHAIGLLVTNVRKGPGDEQWDGALMARELSDQYPGLRIVVVTGYHWGPSPLYYDESRVWVVGKMRATDQFPPILDALLKVE